MTDSHKSVVHMIVAQAARFPDRWAIRFREQQVSYGQLLQRSQVYAGELRARGIGSGDLVALCSSPCPDFLVALLGIWQCGAVYCPLDPSHPPAYRQQMLELAQPKLLLVDASSAALADLASHPQLLLDPRDVDPRQESSQFALSLDLDQAAYLFFTSGTTGKPKAVLGSHRNLTHYLGVAREAFGFRDTDCFLSVARATFSISLFDLVSPLCIGAQLQLCERREVLDPARLHELLADVSVVHLGPSLLHSFFSYLKQQPDRPQSLPQLRHVSSGGDVVSPMLMADMKRVFPAAELFVIYGSTEISCMGTYYPISRGTVQTKSLVGSAFPDVEVYVLDEQLQEQGVDQVGEICFSGLGLALGYFRQPEREEGRFVSWRGRRLYRMGDMGRWQPGGQLEILGRRDYQIQLRGIRIELLGIEHTVREKGLAEQCAVVHKVVDQQEYLVFFLVDPRYPDIVSFRKQLSVWLPEDMLPQAIVKLPSLPLNVNGKLDRQALQLIPWQQDVHTCTASAGDQSLQQQLANLFAEILHQPSVGPDQSFFELGGHSLLAVYALQEAKKRLGLTIPPQIFFDCPTVRHILQHLQDGHDQGLRPIALNEAAGKPKLFMLAGVQSYRALSVALAGAFHAFAVFACEELSTDGTTVETMAIEYLAEIYLKQIKAVQAEGPYHLLGYSFAGIVAFEIAQKLRKNGEKVDLLVLIDAIIPEWHKKRSFRWQQVRRLLRRPAPDVLRFLVRRLGEKFLARGRQWNKFLFDPRLGDIEGQRILLKSLAANHYLEHRSEYPDPCLLIVSEDRLRRDPLKSRSCGWSEVIPHLEVQGVPADHFAMMEVDGDVEAVAQIVRRYFAEQPQLAPATGIQTVPKP